MAENKTSKKIPPPGENCAALLCREDALDEVKNFIRSNPNAINEIIDRDLVKDSGAFIKTLKGTLLHFACLFNRIKVATYLLSQPNVNLTPKFDEREIKYGIFFDDKKIGEFNGLNAKEIAEKKKIMKLSNFLMKEKKEKKEKNKKEKNLKEKQKKEKNLKEKQKKGKEPVIIPSWKISFRI